jgi:protein SCO1
MPWPGRPRARRPLRSGRTALVVAALAALAPLAACDDMRPYNGLVYDSLEPAPALALGAPGGRTFDLAGERGKVVLVFFGYTRCPDVCPTTLADWAKVKRALGTRADRVRFVFVSVDPERDTPEATHRYAQRFDPAFVGLAGTPAQTEEVKRAWKVAAYPDVAMPGDTAHGGAHGDSASHRVVHSPPVFVVDRQGRLRLVYTSGATSDEVAADIARLL